MASLLIAVDLQKGWKHKTATEAIMLRAVELCKEFQGDVIHCCFRNDPASLFHSQLHWDHFVEPAETDQIPEVAPLNLKRYWRSTYSCLTPELVPLIRQYDHVYLVGVFTDVSIATTAMGIFDMNIPVTVVSNCVGTLHGEDVHVGALRSLEFSIGNKNVIDAESVLQSQG